MSGISCTPIASIDSDARGRDIAPSQRVEVGGWKLEKVVTTRLGDRGLGVTWAWGRVESYRLGVLESRDMSLGSETYPKHKAPSLVVCGSWRKLPYPRVD